MPINYFTDALHHHQVKGLTTGGPAAEKLLFILTTTLLSVCFGLFQLLHLRFYLQPFKALLVWQFWTLAKCSPWTETAERADVLHRLHFRLQLWQTQHKEASWTAVSSGRLSLQTDPRETSFTSTPSSNPWRNTVKLHWSLVRSSQQTIWMNVEISRSFHTRKESFISIFYSWKVFVGALSVSRNIMRKRSTCESFPHWTISPLYWFKYQDSPVSGSLCGK